MSERARRRRRILELIGAGPVATQEELTALLAAEGLAATQPTLSRDLRELGVAKTPDGHYRLAGRPGGVESGRSGRWRSAGSGGGVSGDGVSGGGGASLLRSLVVRVEAAGTLAVVRTGPGQAQAAASLIDELGLERCVGTVAGDDTLFLAARSGDEARRLVRDLLGRMPASVAAGAGGRADG